MLCISAFSASNPCVGPSPRIKTSFLVLSTCTEELISTRKIIVLLRNPALGCEKAPFPSNPIPYPEYLYLLISAFSVLLTAPNKQFSKVMSSL